MRAKPRSRSVDEYDDSRMEDLIERLRLTSYGPTKAVKGNRRGFSIHEPLATLESLLRKLTEDIAFDLEISRLKKSNFRFRTHELKLTFHDRVPNALGSREPTV